MVTMPGDSQPCAQGSASGGAQEACKGYGTATAKELGKAGQALETPQVASRAADSFLQQLSDAGFLSLKCYNDEEHSSHGAIQVGDESQHR